MAPGLTRRRGISRTTLPSHWVNLNGGTSVATSIAGSEASTSCRKRIQVLRMPVSPSGRRTRCGPTASDTVRKTVSASGSGMLPTRCTIGCVRSALMVSSPCRRLPLACDCSATFLLIFPRTDEEHHCGRGARKQLPGSKQRDRRALRAAAASSFDGDLAAAGGLRPQFRFRSQPGCELSRRLPRNQQPHGGVTPTAGSRSASVTASVILRMIGSGVPFGTAMPHQFAPVNPGSPLSIKVGTSGSCCNRCSVATASALSLPSLSLKRRIGRRSRLRTGSLGQSVSRVCSEVSDSYRPRDGSVYYGYRTTKILSHARRPGSRLAVQIAWLAPATLCCWMIYYGTEGKQMGRAYE